MPYQGVRRFMFCHRVNEAKDTALECAVARLAEELVMQYDQDYPGVERRVVRVRHRLTSVKQCAFAILNVMRSECTCKPVTLPDHWTATKTRRYARVGARVFVCS